MPMVFVSLFFFDFRIFQICDHNAHNEMMEFTVPSTSSFPLSGIVCLWAGLGDMQIHLVMKVRSLSETSCQKEISVHWSSWYFDFISIPDTIQSYTLFE